MSKIILLQMILFEMIVNIVDVSHAFHLLSDQCPFLCDHGRICRYLYTENGDYVPACVVSDTIQPITPPDDEQTSTGNKQKDRLSRGLAEALNAIYRGHRPDTVRDSSLSEIFRRTSQLQTTQPSSNIPITPARGHVTLPTVTTSHSQVACIPCVHNDECSTESHYCYHSPECAQRTCHAL